MFLGARVSVSTLCSIEYTVGVFRIVFNRSTDQLIDDHSDWKKLKPTAQIVKLVVAVVAFINLVF